MKELALRKRFVRWSERHNEHTKNLKPLRIGDRVFVQNQEGPHPRKWDRSGLVVDVLPHCKYRVKIDGSGRVTSRNRQFLRLLKTASPTITDLPPCRNAEDLHATRRPIQSDMSERTDTPPLGKADTRVNESVLDVCEQTVSGDESLSVEIESTAHNQPQDVVATEEPEVLPKKHLELRRLENYNSPGLRDSVELPKTRLRPRR